MEMRNHVGASKYIEYAYIV